jgi:hypothetical protein
LINFEDTVSMRKNYGMNQNEIRQAINIVVENQEFLQVKWREIYG